jgi:hypothetical protein
MARKVPVAVYTIPNLLNTGPCNPCQKFSFVTMFTVARCRHIAHPSTGSQHLESGAHGVLFDEKPKVENLVTLSL